MFLTYQHAKIDKFELFGAEPIAWSHVEHSIHRPWFYVATTEPDEHFESHPMLMLSTEQLLCALIADQTNGLRVNSVLLVTPDHVNQLGRWTMEPLESIERYESSKGCTLAYRVASGKTYVYGDEDAIRAQGVSKQILFDGSMINA